MKKRKERSKANMLKILKWPSWIFWLSSLIFIFALSGGRAETERRVEEIKGSLSLEAVSRDWGVPASYLIEGLKLPKDGPLNLSLKELKDKHGFTIEDVRKLVLEYRGRGKSGQISSTSPENKKGVGHEAEKRRDQVELPLVLYGLLCLTMLILLRKRKITNWLAISILLPPLFIFGVIFQAHPEPMRAMVQVFQAIALGMYSLEPTLVVFLVFALMTFIGVKLVCGWGCPVGTLQEILYRLPIFKNIKNKMIPFWISSSFRLLFLAFFLILLFGSFPGWQDQSIYRYFNPFRLFDWNFRVTAPIFIVLIFGFSLIQYRPYCMFVCPFGLFSWLIQDISIFKIRINWNTCLECGKCGRACPSGAAQAILDGKTFKPDCFACARCLKVCPNNSLEYRAF
ncbi:MAG: 4Fe-4S binding protein [Thermodesulfobacteriota bacterium]